MARKSVPSSAIERCGRLYFGVPRATNRETEIKLPVADVEALLPRLGELHAVCQGRVFEQNTLYDTPDSALRGAGRLLRFRVVTPAGSEFFPSGAARSLLTSKAPLAERSAANPNYKERLEREVVVPGSQSWPRTLSLLGFRAGFRYEKYRTSFRLPGLHVDLDETAVGTFLELEGELKAIDRVAQALGFSAGDYIRDTYWDIYAADCRRRGVAATNLVFVRKKIGK